ncbi:MAG: hypothetical protein K2I56_07235 [Muribaculaceae bacterium]|nr:hypothetical protein [Muribaculaceae bacterium]
MRILLRDRYIDVPAQPDELTPEQYRYYVFLASAYQAGDISGDQLRCRLFSYLAGLGSLDYTMLIPEYVAQAEKAMPDVLAGFMRRSTGPDGRAKVELQFGSCRNLLPEVDGYRGPLDWLHGLSYGDFVQCLTILPDCSDQSDEVRAAAMEAMARTLYKVPEGAGVPPVLLFHAPVFFATVWNAISSGPVTVNGRSIDLSIIFRSSGGERRPDDRTGWIGITFEIAKANVFGNVREVEAAGFWEVLLYLYKCKFEYLHEKKE